LSIVITPGEPAGIGPDLVVQAASQGLSVPALVIGDPDMLAQRASRLKLDISILESDTCPTTALPGGELMVHPVTMQHPCTPGKPDFRNAGYVLECLRTAAQGCLTKKYAGMVTGPVHKGIINNASIPFTGHTEFLAELSNSYPVMMLACPGLRVALATTHLPLSEVSRSITETLLTKVIKILHADLKNQFHINNPKILVCGLNPHAGESGHLGDEEIKIISPVLETLRSKGVQLFGPLPADTLFTPRYLEQADAVLAMYHDQGLPVLKYKCFGNAVNITLGLPFIRTSVDHGTALDLAGTGKANLGSLLAAIKQASEMLDKTPGIK
jgi:4-hydroxythreonine-4-phosphate dehydrogenase